MNRRIAAQLVVSIALLSLIVALPRPALALRKRGTWNIQSRAQPDAQTGGWFINLGITGARAKILVEAPKVLEVAYVFEKTPAAGKLQVGDRIVGANGKPFVTALILGIKHRRLQMSGAKLISVE